MYTEMDEATKKLAREGIEGWGLQIVTDHKHLFDFVETQPVNGCISETCHHTSHDPAAPDYKAIPKKGYLIYLGNSYDIDYYLLFADKCYALEVTRPKQYYSKISVIDFDSVPQRLWKDTLSATGVKVINELPETEVMAQIAVRSYIGNSRRDLNWPLLPLDIYPTTMIGNASDKGNEILITTFNCLVVIPKSKVLTILQRGDEYLVVTDSEYLNVLPHFIVEIEDE